MHGFKALYVLLAVSRCGLAFQSFGIDSRRASITTSSVVETLTGPPTGWIIDHGFQFDKDASTIATPGHELYGSHLTQQIINGIIAPKTESRDLVMQWLESENLSDLASISLQSDAVIVEATITQVEKLLKANYNTFVRPESGERVVRTLKYSLPDILRDHVDLVQPTTCFGLQATRPIVSEVGSIEKNAASKEAIEAVTGCGGSTITPKCLANLYNFASSDSNQTAGIMGIAGFLSQHPSKSDLSTILQNYAIFNDTAQTYTCTLINGGTCPSSGTPGTEANLDVQYARTITKSIPNVFYSVGGSPPIVGGGTNTNEPYLEFLDYLLALDNTMLPNTISISYGDDEATVPLDYANSVCNLFSQLGARGVSVLVASGDSGVGTTCESGTTKTFTTTFPASCAFVTVVGGVTGTSPEGAWSASGGGFSSVFGRPSYQNAAVTSWLQNDKTHSAVTSYFNSSGRAYPDVAAQSTDFAIVESGSSELVSGTSCAAPTFASIVQLLNSDRIAAGKAPLGFLNPWLYSNATSGLNDITTGKNIGCSGVISGAGFSAVSGWDPSTGLGTPNYASLLTISRAT